MPTAVHMPMIRHNDQNCVVGDIVFDGLQLHLCSIEIKLLLDHISTEIWLRGLTVTLVTEMWYVSPLFLVKHHS